MAEIIGEDVLVYVDGALLAATRGYTENHSWNEIDVSTKDSGNYSAYVIGRAQQTLDVDGLYTTISGMQDLETAMFARNQVTLQRWINGAADKTASAYITSFTVTAQDEDVATASATFRINGGWTDV